jgi:hypothetical protein
MSKEILCKFKVDHLEKIDACTNASLSPVFSDDPEHENSKFWEYTPCGNLTLSVTNDSLGGVEIGQEYYLRLSLAS